MELIKNSPPWLVLEELTDRGGSLNQAQLSESIGLNHSNLPSTLDWLLDRGYVDSSNNLYTVTEVGRVVMGRLKSNSIEDQSLTPANLISRMAGQYVPSTDFEVCPRPGAWDSRKLPSIINGVRVYR